MKLYKRLDDAVVRAIAVTITNDDVAYIVKSEPDRHTTGYFVSLDVSTLDPNQTVIASAYKGQLSKITA